MFTMEILSHSKQFREHHTASSGLTLFDLRQKVASSLDIYPNSLQIQYRFSTDLKATPPCDLITHVHFATLMNLLRERCVPRILASGRRSTKNLKQFTLQVFVKGDSPFVGAAEAKVSLSLLNY